MTPSSKLRRWHSTISSALYLPPEKKTKVPTLEALEFIDDAGNVLLRVALTNVYAIESERKLLLLDRDEKRDEFKLSCTTGLVDLSKVASIRLEKKHGT